MGKYQSELRLWWELNHQCRAYEGLKPHEIREKRQSHGLDSERKWDIWRDGCEDGEYVHSLTSFQMLSSHHSLGLLPKSLIASMH